MAGRRLGQHFLSSTSALERIASAACQLSNGTVVEIGPGRGALTQHLLTRAERVFAIEVDPVLVGYLREKFRNEPKLTILHADILKADLTAWGPVTIVGNLPYYITSPIIERVLSLGPLLLNAVFLVQKEVAERLAAKPGSRDYGYLTVQTQLLSDPSLLFTVPPGAFRPPPKVDSAVVELRPRSKPLIPDPEAFLSFASACFRHKRKTIRNNLAGLYAKAALDAQPEAAMRAEQLSVEQLADLRDRILKFP